MFGIGMPELIVVLVLALLIFGAKSLPGIGSGLGNAIRGFREATGELGKPAHPQPVASSLTCPHCGSGYAGEATFCPQCGKKLRVA
jgi:TatA/E family protein of Tat protein translocase